MASLNTYVLESNTRTKINFDGGDLSSDAGLLLLNEFLYKIGATDLIKKLFKTNDTTSCRIHKDPDNLLQVLFQIFGAYFEDDLADELRTDPVLTEVLGKDALASQPTLSRFFNRMDQDTLDQLSEIQRRLRKIVYSIDRPTQILLDLDSTLLDTYGKQEGAAFNFHYSANGYHPLVCYDGMTGDLLKAELRNGSMYCGKDSGAFMEPLLKELREDYPGMKLLFRADSGFATPELYEVLEEHDCQYAIRLKQNTSLMKLAAEKDEALTRAVNYKQDVISRACEYGEFMYQAKGWSHPRRVVFQIEKPYGQFIHNYTFIVTTFETLRPDQVMRFYRDRGRMENFIKESKNGFDFCSVSSSPKMVNANRLQIHALAYNLFNYFKRLVLPKEMRHLQANTIRIKLLKVAARIIRSARYKVFKLCSSFPYQKEFVETLHNIRRLRPQLA